MSSSPLPGSCPPRVHHAAPITALTLLDVLSAYATQTLDEVQSFSVDGADTLEDIDAETMRALQQRVQCIRAVLRVIHQWRERSGAVGAASLPGDVGERTHDSEADRDDAAHEHARYDPATRAVARLTRVHDTLTGRSAPARSARATAGSSLSGSALSVRPSAVSCARVVAPGGQLVGLMEAVLELQGHNTRTVYRRRAGGANAPSARCDGVEGSRINRHGTTGGSRALLHDPTAHTKRPRLDHVGRTDDGSTDAMPIDPAAQASVPTSAHASGRDRRAAHVGVQDGGDVAVAEMESIGSIYTRLGQEQRARRARLYSGQLTLLPRTELAMHPYFVSSAVREFITLNAEAEDAMARHSWAVRVKTQLLRELPKLCANVRNYHDDAEHERANSRGSTASHGTHPDCDGSDEAVGRCGPHALPGHFYFDAHHRGVVRVCVQRGLLWLDLSLHPERPEGWAVLRMYWNVWVSVSSTIRTEPEFFTLAPATAEDAGAREEKESGSKDVTGTPAELGANHHSASPCSVSITSALRILTCPMEQPSSSAPGTWRRVQPPHELIMLGYLQRRFAEAGLDGGCMAANHLLSTVLMDTITYQLSGLQKSVFVGPLSDVLRLEVRPGTYVACRFTPPLFISSSSACSADGPFDVSSIDAAEVPGKGASHHAHTTAREYNSHTGDSTRRCELLVKYSVGMGTVLVERTWGADVHSRRIETLAQALASVLTPAEKDARRARIDAAMGNGTSGLTERETWTRRDERGRMTFCDPLAMVIDMEEFLWQSVLSPPAVKLSSG